MESEITTNKPLREDGFYWVKPKSEYFNCDWLIAEYSEGWLGGMGWIYTNGGDEVYPDSEFMLIDEKKITREDFVNSKMLDFDSLSKFMQHTQDCNLNKGHLWDEADAAMADTPEQFRDEKYHNALLEIDTKRKQCTCGLSLLKEQLCKKQ